MFVKPLYINEESDKYFEINNFNKVTTYYDEYKNDIKYRECEICGKRFKVGKNGRNKYCNVCARKINIEKTKKRRN